MLGRAISLGEIPAEVTQYKDLQRTHWAYSAIMEASVDHEYEMLENKPKGGFWCTAFSSSM
jgi:hypothetical protein